MNPESRNLRPGGHPDRAILAAHAALLLADDAIEADNGNDGWDESRMARDARAFEAALDRLAGLRPVTMEGLRAKADAVMVALQRCTCGNPAETVLRDGEQHDRLAFRFAQDVLGFRGVGDPMPATPPVMPPPVHPNRPPGAPRPAK